MIERTSEIITIYRPVTGKGPRPLAEVYPEATSIRKFTLMSEDYVQLDFTLDAPISFEVGDYINDELFGRFVIIEKQMPEYNDTTGGYKYTLKFSAEYMGWKNYIFMLTTDASGERVRKETTWYLTNNLDAQVEELCNNLLVIYGEKYSYMVRDEVEKAKEIKCMTWEGVSIYDALGQLADEWECEWWVDREANILYFGKCEDTETEIEDFTAGDNVAKMTIQQNQNTFANKIYAFGGTRNLPASYRRDLIIKVESLTGYYYTPDKKITPDMFKTLSSADGEITMPAGDKYAHIYDTDHLSTSFEKQYTGATFNIPQVASYVVTIPAWTAPAINITTPRVAPGTEVAIEVTRTLYLYNGGKLTKVWERTDTPTLASQKATAEAVAVSAITDTYDLTDGGSYFVYNVDVSVSCGLGSISVDALAMDDATLASGSANKSIPIPATFVYNGTTTNLYIVFNPKAVKKYTDAGALNTDYYQFIITDADGVRVSAPTGFAVGSSLTLDDMDGLKIPTSFYTMDTDNPAALARIGETRLRMPEADAPGGYVMKSGITEAQVVELAVSFDDIYPDAKLVVASVTAEEKTDVEKYEGESERTDWQWHEYTLELNVYNDGAPTPLVFSNDYILANTTLQLRFLTADDMGWDADEYADIIKLSGMTFEVQYNRAQNTFTLVRNTDYGCALPNDVLLPIVGAPCQLIGWDVRALKDTGIIATAESELYAKALEYLDALEDEQFTFTCQMAFDYLFESLEYLQLQTSAGENVLTSDGENFLVKNDYNAYNLPTEGHRVRINHDALKTSKETRIIGYEFKLDKPYDGPTYTVGETQAYSRLAKIERELTKITK